MTNPVYTLISSIQNQLSEKYAVKHPASEVGEHIIIALPISQDNIEIDNIRYRVHQQYVTVPKEYLDSIISCYYTLVLINQNNPQKLKKIHLDLDREYQVHLEEDLNDIDSNSTIPLSENGIKTISNIAFMQFQLWVNKVLNCQRRVPDLIATDYAYINKQLERVVQFENAVEIRPSLVLPILGMINFCRYVKSLNPNDLTQEFLLSLKDANARIKNSLKAYFNSKDIFTSVISRFYIFAFNENLVPISIGAILKLKQAEPIPEINAFMSSPEVGLYIAGINSQYYYAKQNNPLSVFEAIQAAQLSARQHALNPNAPAYIPIMELRREGPIPMARQGDANFLAQPVKSNKGSRYQ